MLHLPPSASPLRSMFEVADLVPLGTHTGRASLPTFRQAIDGARSFFSTNTDKAVRSLNFVTLRATGEVWLITVGPKGGWRKRWNFGNPIAS